MAKKQSIKKLSQHDEQVVKKMVEKASAFTPEEVRAAIEAQPKGAMAMTVAVNLNYDRFVDAFVEKMAALMTNQTEEQLTEYRERIRNIWNMGIQREAAVYWYTLGATHHDEIIDSVINLKDQNKEG
jgi:hypothetical protein